MTEQTPKGESKANGLAEGAVRDCKAKVRTIKYATEKFLGVVIDHDHWSLPFICKYAGATMARGRRGPDGKTPYERRFGKKWRAAMVRFGEHVLWLPSGKRDSRLESGYRSGIYLGLDDVTGQHIVGTKEG